jgi:hypothetical protein
VSSNLFSFNELGTNFRAIYPSKPTIRFLQSPTIYGLNSLFLFSLRFLPPFLLEVLRPCRVLLSSALEFSSMIESTSRDVSGTVAGVTIVALDGCSVGMSSACFLILVIEPALSRLPLPMIWMVEPRGDGLVTKSSAIEWALERLYEYCPDSNEMGSRSLPMLFLSFKVTSMVLNCFISYVERLLSEIFDFLCMFILLTLCEFIDLWYATEFFLISGRAGCVSLSADLLSSDRRSFYTFFCASGR